METLSPGIEGHPPTRVNFSKRLYEEKKGFLCLSQQHSRLPWLSRTGLVDPFIYHFIFSRYYARQFSWSLTQQNWKTSCGRGEWKDEQQITHAFRSSHQIVFPVSIRVLYMMEIFIVILLKQQISTDKRRLRKGQIAIWEVHCLSEVKRFALLNFIRNAKNPENTFTHVFYQEKCRFRLEHPTRSS